MIVSVPAAPAPAAERSPARTHSGSGSEVHFDDVLERATTEQTPERGRTADPAEDSVTGRDHTARDESGPAVPERAPGHSVVVGGAHDARAAAAELSGHGVDADAPGLPPTPPGPSTPAPPAPDGTSGSADTSTVDGPDVMAPDVMAPDVLVPEVLPEAVDTESGSGEEEAVSDSPSGGPVPEAQTPPPSVVNLPPDPSVATASSVTPTEADPSATGPLAAPDGAGAPAAPGAPAAGADAASPARPSTGATTTEPIVPGPDTVSSAPSHGADPGPDVAPTPPGEGQDQTARPVPGSASIDPPRAEPATPATPATPPGPGSSTVPPAPVPLPAVTPTVAPSGSTPTGGLASPPPPVAEQVMAHISPLADGPDGSHEIRIELQPAELGSLRLDVRVEDGTVHVRIHADDSSARRLLAQSMDDLRHALNHSGLHAGDLDVDHRGFHDRDVDGRDQRPGERDDRTGPQAVARPRPRTVPVSTRALDVRI